MAIFHAAQNVFVGHFCTPYSSRKPIILSNTVLTYQSRWCRLLAASQRRCTADRVLNENKEREREDEYGAKFW